MKHILITGSTRGIGSALATAFLERGHAVTISGRKQESIDRAEEYLSQRFDPGLIHGLVCDVRQPEQVQRLWDAAQSRAGHIDIWINNAGYAHAPSKLWLLEPQLTQAVIETNLLGTIYGSQVAVRGMLAQGAGAIYNMEGMGSDGRKHDGLMTYGASKYGVHYLSMALAEELAGTDVIIASLRPGMVATDMILDPYRGKPAEWERVKRIFNIIAELPEVVAPWLVDKMLRNQRSGVVISYSSTLKIALRFLRAPFSKRDLFQGFDPEMHAGDET
jgi:NAD(P)-dependent dehydrogenase (short-subunit alcohol dehydrogenase family)